MYSNDFSLFALFTAGFAALASAQTLGNNPSGHTIYTPGLNQQVPVGTPFNITWNPSPKSASVSLYLLRGPATNLKSLGPIATKTEDDGSYMWTPSSDLEPENTHYGIILVAEDGTYQYTTQFGIVNPSYGGGHASSSASASASDTMSVPPPYKPTSTPGASTPTSGKPTDISSVVSEVTSSAETPAVTASSGSPVYNSSVSCPPTP